MQQGKLTIIFLLLACLLLTACKPKEKPTDYSEFKASVITILEGFEETNDMIDCIDAQSKDAVSLMLQYISKQKENIEKLESIEYIGIYEDLKPWAAEAVSLICECQSEMNDAFNEESIDDEKYKKGLEAYKKADISIQHIIDRLYNHEDNLTK